jgi:hypothetical protein
MPLTGTTRDREQCCQQHSTPDRSTRVNEDEERQPANNRRAGSDPDGDRAPTRLSVSIRMGCHQLWAFLGAITELDEPYYSQVNTSSLERSVCFPFPVGGPSKLGFGLMGEMAHAANAAHLPELKSGAPQLALAAARKGGVRGVPARAANCLASPHRARGKC